MMNWEYHKIIELEKIRSHDFGKRIDDDYEMIKKHLSVENDKWLNKLLEREGVK